MNRQDEIMTRLGCFPIKPETRREPSEEDLIDLEQELGGRLPTDYRRFLSKYGRTALDGHVVAEIREPCPWGQECYVEVFLGFSTEPSESIQHAVFQVYAGKIPDETICIAEDPGGNMLLLGFDEPVVDNVFFWDHEHRELAGNFDAMWNEVRAGGVDTSCLDVQAMIWHWEELYSERLVKPRGFGNVYRIADTFAEFLESLRKQDQT